MGGPGAGAERRYCARPLSGRRPVRLLLAWSGVAGDPSLYYTAFDGTSSGRQHNYLGTGSTDVPSVLVTFLTPPGRPRAVEVACRKVRVSVTPPRRCGRPVHPGDPAHYLPEVGCPTATGLTATMRFPWSELLRHHVVVSGGQFHLDPGTYLDAVRSEVPAYDEFQNMVAEATMAMVAQRILGLGVGNRNRRSLMGPMGHARVLPSWTVAPSTSSTSPSPEDWEAAKRAGQYRVDLVLALLWSRWSV